jgi:hypothetical protein
MGSEAIMRNECLKSAPVGHPASAPGVGSPGEVEITPEMIEAGTEAFYQWQDLRFGTGRVAAIAIFKAMARLAPKSHIPCKEEET